MLSEQRLRRWLREVRQGRRPIASVIEQLKVLPYDSLECARVDTHRRLRRGLPEVVWCEGKSPTQMLEICRRLIRHHELLLLTRLPAETAAQLQRALPALRYEPLARLGYWIPPRTRMRLRGLVVIASGGTADLPVAEEAARTLELLGSRAVRLYDVGVAGLHRVLEAFPTLQRAKAIVVVAGMEGALPSVVAGLVRCPVIAAPTSIGYGAHQGGVAPLLTMLNSCVPGIGVVNIDNGFGAGYLAHVINIGSRHSSR